MTAGARAEAMVTDDNTIDATIAVTGTRSEAPLLVAAGTVRGPPNQVHEKC